MITPAWKTHQKNRPSTNTTSLDAGPLSGRIWELRKYVITARTHPTCVRDGNGIEQYRTYDKMGNLTALFPPAQGTDGPCWTYRYDFFDRLIETRDPMGNIWKKERNLSGDILCEQMPDGREIRYEYDADSRKIRTVYADGSTERCFYDGNGNLIKKSGRRTTWQRPMTASASLTSTTA